MDAWTWLGSFAKITRSDIIDAGVNGTMKWTSHPLVDVGIATLCAMANRSRPEDSDADDLNAATEELAEVYFSGIMVSYLTCVFMSRR